MHVETLLQKRAFVSDYLLPTHNDHTVIGVTWVQPASVYRYHLHAIFPAALYFHVNDPETAKQNSTAD